jgi:hypothetical protein
MKIFNFSLTRSATSTIHDALQILGFSSRHDAPNGLPVHFLLPENEHLLRGEFDKYDAISSGLGFYGTAAMQMVLDNYPDARYIIVRRELQDWLDCWNRQRTIRILIGSEKSLPPNDVIVTRWRSHKEFVDKMDVKHLLDIGIADLSWDKLAPFLGKPVPDRPFPVRNVSSKQISVLLAERWGTR